MKCVVNALIFRLVCKWREVVTQEMPMVAKTEYPNEYP